MELRGYFDILIRRKWGIILTVVVTTAVVIIGTHFQTPIYQSSTTLRIATSAGIQISSADYMFADRLINTYVGIATSRPVLDELVKRLGLSKAPDIKAEVIPNTELIKITVEDTNSQTATDAANTLADILITQSSQLYAGGGKSSEDVLAEQLANAQNDLNETREEYQQLLIQTPPAPEKIDIARQTLNLQQNTYATLLLQYEQARTRDALRANMVTVIEAAVVPVSPSKPRVLLNYALGLVVGLIGGLGLAFIFENLDTTLYTTDEIEALIQLRTLAKIPKANKKQINIAQDGSSQFAETFRNLAINIQLIDHQKPCKVLLFMSAEPRQGKSIIVSNLAFALAEAGKKVVAIDCDLRIPKLHSLFHLPNQYGLRDVLERRAGLIKSLQKSQIKGVTVLTSGSIPEHPSKVLNSPQMAETIEKLRPKYDYVLLDTPAMLAVSEIATLAHYADGLILIVRQNYARRESVQAASKFLDLFPGKAIGRIVNQTEDNKSYGYYQYHSKSGIRVKTE